MDLELFRLSAMINERREHSSARREFSPRRPRRLRRRGPLYPRSVVHRREAFLPTVERDTVLKLYCSRTPVLADGAAGMYAGVMGTHPLWSPGNRGGPTLAPVHVHTHFARGLARCSWGSCANFAKVLSIDSQ